MFLDNPLISGIIFPLRKIKEPRDLGSNIKILKLTVDKDIELGGICYLKDSNLPTVLMFHGNGEICLDYMYFYEGYHDINVNLAVVDYRGYGFSTGSPNYGSLFNDAMPVFNQFLEWVDNNKMKNSLFVMGRSLGSVCASEIGSNNPKDLRGIIFESGFANLYKFVSHFTGLWNFNIPLPERELNKYSNDLKIEKFQKPTLILHGAIDNLIPCEQSEMIFNAIPDSVDKKLIMINGAGHNDIGLFKKEYFPPLKEFIEKYK